MRKTTTEHLIAQKITGYYPQDSREGKALGRAALAALNTNATVAISLAGLEGFSLGFARGFYRELMEAMAPREILYRVHVESSNHIFLELFERAFEHVELHSPTPPSLPIAA